MKIHFQVEPAAIQKDCEVPNLKRRASLLDTWHHYLVHLPFFFL